MRPADSDQLIERFEPADNMYPEAQNIVVVCGQLVLLHLWTNECEIVDSIIEVLRRSRYALTSTGLQGKHSRMKPVNINDHCLATAIPHWYLEQGGKLLKCSTG